MRVTRTDWTVLPTQGGRQRPLFSKACDNLPICDKSKRNETVVNADEAKDVRLDTVYTAQPSQ
jgi:hypothetical protein